MKISTEQTQDFIDNLDKKITINEIFKLWKKYCEDFAVLRFTNTFWNNDDKHDIIQSFRIKHENFKDIIISKQGHIKDVSTIKYKIQMFNFLHFEITKKQFEKFKHIFLKNNFDDFETHQIPRLYQKYKILDNVVLFEKTNPFNKKHLIKLIKKIINDKEMSIDIQNDYKKEDMLEIAHNFLIVTILMRRNKENNEFELIISSSTNKISSKRIEITKKDFNSLRDFSLKERNDRFKDYLIKELN